MIEKKTKRLNKTFTHALEHLATGQKDMPAAHINISTSRLDGLKLQVITLRSAPQFKLRSGNSAAFYRSGRKYNTEYILKFHKKFNYQF